jgi:hypothetical protein
MPRKSTAQDLIRLHKARERERRLNDRRPVHLRQTSEQITSRTRRALDEGRINDHGVILKKE